MHTNSHFDAIIVGSGFGGSVMAYRLRKAGLSVCLLERGKPYPPGSFPRTPSGMRRNFWDPSEGCYGMFDVWSFSGLEALVSSGLGGGSLIYANVLLRKDERWFVDDDLPGNGHREWPVTRADLDPHYAAVEKMLGATPYPFGEPLYNRTPKTRAMLAAAQRMGRHRDWRLPPLAVTFAAADGVPPTPGDVIVGGERNLHHRPRSTCRLCGECDVGCNYGSKNTLDYNYLSRAQELGADIRVLCEVRTFAPRSVGGGYVVRYVRHDLDREGRPFPTSRLPLEEITADRLVVAAGTLGSTYLLLRNRENLPALSQALGTRFCGNGDLLTFALGCTETKDGRTQARDMDPSFGPVITSALRVADALDETDERGRGFYVEDAGIPAFTTWLAEATDAVGAAKRVVRFVGRRLRRYVGLPAPSHLSSEMAALIGSAARSSAALPLLGMGRDIPDGRMTLDKNKWLENDWNTKSSRAYFDRVRSVMAEMGKAWGATTFRDNPLWYLKRVITVHPLGGCPMGRSPQDGVVDEWGEVFGHPGLFVADGSVLPGPVGANPSLTIAALADRFADHLIERTPRRASRVGGEVAAAEVQA